MTTKTDGPQFGKVIPDGENPGRDAVHVAVAPVTLEHDMSPGTHVALSDGGKVYEVVEGGIGIVDPFIRDNLKKGDRCYVFLYPGTITGLRHVWVHPAFAPKPAVKE